MFMMQVQVMAGNGIELVRTWAFLNGDDDPLTLNGTLSIQPKASFVFTYSLQLFACHPVHEVLYRLST